MKRSLSFLVWIRRTLGVAVIIGVVIVILHSQKPVVLTASAALVDEGPMPDLGGAVGWLNSAPLNRKSLRGKVVLADFWTYTCINSLRPLPYVKSWATKYKDAGLVVIRSAFKPQPGDIVALEHWGSSGFANTDLDLQLKNTASISSSSWDS
jgi:hypothetical protein